MLNRGRHTRSVRRGVLAVLVVVLGIGALALTASGREGGARPVAPAKKPQAAAELPPLPDMRPKVVEPVAGNAGGASGPVTDPGLSEVGPKPNAPASAGTRRLSSVRRADPTKSVALGNGVALPPLEAPEE